MPDAALIIPIFAAFSRLFGVAKLQSARGADNPRYAAMFSWLDGWHIDERWSELIISLGLSLP